MKLSRSSIKKSSPWPVGCHQQQQMQHGPQLLIGLTNCFVSLCCSLVANKPSNACDRRSGFMAHPTSAGLICARLAWLQILLTRKMPLCLKEGCQEDFASLDIAFWRSELCHKDQDFQQHSKRPEPFWLHLHCKGEWQEHQPMAIKLICRYWERGTGRSTAENTADLEWRWSSGSRQFVSKSDMFFT